MTHKFPWLTATLLSLAIGHSLSFGAVKLPAIISDNMILQKSAQTPIWGWANPGEKVTVSINGQSATTTAGENKKWLVHLNLSKSEKGPFELSVVGTNSLTIKNVLIGQVWLASGQSNMEFAVWSTKDAQQEIATADYPEIRQFHAAYLTALTPQDDNPGISGRNNPGGWVVCSPKTAGSFTAVGYFFARDIHQQVHTPVGLIHTSWGGTPAEAWTSQETLSHFPEWQTQMKLLDELTGPNSQKVKEQMKQEIVKWQKNPQYWPQDTGNVGFEKGWAKPDLDLSDWKSVKVPGMLEFGAPELKDFDGCIWFRTEFTLTEEQSKQNLRMDLGSIDDFDTTYLNGEKIGETDTDLENSWKMQRLYPIPAKLLKVGKNVIAVRVFDRGGGGGIGTADPDHSARIMADSKVVLSLAGDWKYKIERQVPTVDLPKVMLTRPITFEADQNSPTCLYNAMLHPFIPYGIAGAIWYQGEANAGQAYLYRKLFPAMITDWRTKWKKAGGQEDIPFYFVQLANWQARLEQPSESDWAELREAQQMTLKLPNTGTAVAIDIGDAVNIHPTNKQDVGHRLALNALAKVYGQNVEFSGPLFETKKIEGDKIRLTFTHAASLRAGRELPLPGAKRAPLPIKGFAICGADHKFVWANATIDGSSVIVSSPDVKSPTEVRYGWANNPEVNLYNGAGLPASPFRTDDFPGITQPVESK